MLGGAAVVVGGGALAASSGRVRDAALGGDEWTLADVPTTETLHHVTHAADGLHAVGTDGVVLRGDAAGWVTLTEEGPSGDGADLHAVDATADGERVWVAGDSGALGVYDVPDEAFETPPTPWADDEAAGDHADYSEPGDYTGNFRGIAVTDEAGAATVHLGDGSGQVHESTDGGETWTYTTPGEGASIPALDHHAAGAGHAADTNQTVYAVTDGEWRRMGVEDRDEEFLGVASNAPEDAWVVGSEGVVLRYDGAWRAESLGDVTLRGVDVDGTGYVVGSGGEIHAYDGDWSEQETPTDENLHAVERGAGAVGSRGDVAVAVGASGTVLER